MVTVHDEIRDWRRSPRFLLDPPLVGSFGGEPISIYNIGEKGVQAEHRDRIRRGTHGELRFSLPISEKVIVLGGRVAWCRQAKKKGSLVNWPYRSGITVEGIHALTLETLGKLLELDLVRADKSSMERKKALAREKTLRKNEETEAESLPPPVSLSELVTQVQAARTRLHGNPEEKGRWVVLGRKDVPPDQESDDDIVAVWAALGKRSDLNLVALVFDLYPDWRHDTP